MTQRTESSTAADSALVPGNAFEFVSRVYWDELDAFKVLHHSRYAIHVDRAQAALYEKLLGVSTFDPEQDEDSFMVMRSYEIDFVNPLASYGPLCIDLWIERMGRTSCEFGFRFRDQSGAVTFATGRRTIVKRDRRTLRTAPWTDAVREKARLYTRDAAD